MRTLAILLLVLLLAGVFIEWSSRNAFAETYTSSNTKLPNKDYLNLSSFENISEWTASNNGFSIADSMNYREGVQGLNLTKGVTANAVIDKRLLVDLSLYNHISIWVYVPSATLENFSSLYLQFRTSDYTWNNFFRKTFSSLKTGWNFLTCSTSSFEQIGSSNWVEVNDLNIKLYSKHAGDVISVTLDDFEAVKDVYPTKVVLRFDDGRSDCYNLARPILESYGYRGTAAIVTNYVGITGRMSLNQLSILYNENWDLVSHTTTHPYLTLNVSSDVLNHQLADSQKWLLDQGFIRGAQFCVPPGEVSNSTIDDAIVQYYSASLVGQGLNYYPFQDQYHILSKDVFNSSTMLEWGNPSGWFPLSTITGWIDSAVANNQVLIITIHEVNSTVLNGICDYLKKNNVEVVTLSQLFNGLFLPTATDTWVSTTNANAPATFSTVWSRYMPLSGYIFSTNKTGTWTNNTWSAFDINSTWSSVILSLNETIGLKVGFCWFANDTVNNWGNSQIQIITISAPTNNNDITPTPSPTKPSLPDSTPSQTPSTSKIYPTLSNSPEPSQSYTPNNIPEISGILPVLLVLTFFIVSTVTILIIKNRNSSKLIKDKT